jgi:hypothetical protein
MKFLNSKLRLNIKGESPLAPVIILSGIYSLQVGDNNIAGGMINARCSPIFQRLLGPGETLEIVCEEPLKGRYVSVMIPTDSGVLNFCELEVYGRKGEGLVWYGMVWYGMV